jgi:large subunit ribosomal protein L37Ae
MAESKARKTGSAGRFGARYGRVARKRVADIEAEMHGATVDGDSVKRVGTGVWVNEETGETFTGGAYRPVTPGGRGVRRSIRAALEGEGAVDADADIDAEAEDE